MEVTIIFSGLAILALLYLQSYIYQRFWAKGLAVNVQFSSKEAFEGDRLYIKEELTNHKLLPLPWICLKYYMPQSLVFEGEEAFVLDRYQNELFTIMAYQRIQRRLGFTCSKRGFYCFRRVSLVANNILYTKSHSKDYQLSSQLTVFPKLIDSPDLAIIYKKIDTAILAQQLINPDPFEFRGIREYQPTDPFRNINFKATAVSHQLMVNIHAPTAAKKLNIILNLEPYNAYPNLEVYEQSIRLCASIAGHYISENVKVGLVTNGRDIDTREEIVISEGASTAHLYNIYEALARVDLTLMITATMSSMSDYLENLTDRETFYLIISANHNFRFMQAFEFLENNGINAFLIVPAFNDMKVTCTESEKLAIWEADV